MGVLRCGRQRWRCFHLVCAGVVKLPAPFSPAEWLEVPTGVGVSLPVGMPAFKALTVYRCRSGYQASLAVDDGNQWICMVDIDPMRAIEACFRVRFG